VKLSKSIKIQTSYCSVSEEINNKVPQTRRSVVRVQTNVQAKVVQKIIFKKRNEENALMAILFRILFTLGLLVLHVFVVSGEQKTASPPEPHFLSRLDRMALSLSIVDFLTMLARLCIK
jgi:hypothetical protein